MDVASERPSVDVLMLEDRPEDAELLMYALERAGYSTRWRRVETVEGFRSGLADKPDLIFADYKLPQIDAPSALELFKQAGLEIPFIVVSGQVSEELAVECMRLGADDYLLKDRLARLGEAVRQAFAKKRLAREKRHAERQLAESEERYSLAVAGANDGIWDWQLDEDRIYFSSRWKVLLGYEQAELPDTPATWLDRIHPDDKDGFTHGWDRHLHGETPHFRHEYRMLHRDGLYRWFLTRGEAVRHPGGGAYRVAGSHTDITTGKHSEAQLLHKSQHDDLTDLPNRALFLDRLDRALHRQERLQAPAFSVLYLDLDRFKVVNDNLGHLGGDQMLIQVGQRLTGCVRGSDMVARLGGDEFAILLEETESVERTLAITRRVQDALEEPFFVNTEEVFGHASIGIALGAPNHRRGDDVLREADAAMYRAKRRGDGSFEVFDAGMHQQAQGLLKVESELRHALEHDQIRPYYQPIMNLDTLELVGFEALARWEHPERGLISPADFIPIAEETGLIARIGSRILRLACEQLLAWQSDLGINPPAGVSVNLSGRQFQIEGLAHEVGELLSQSGLEPRFLCLEITESVLMDNRDKTQQTLEDLNRLGVRLSIDDFGTGYSSLSYLHRFPIQGLKMDRSFVQSLDQNTVSYEIVRTVAHLSESLGMDLVAEGIESENQVTALRALGYRYGQGFLFAAPIPPEGLTEWLSSGIDQRLRAI